MPGDRTLLSLDASHAIPTCVLHFEDSGLCRRTPVRPVLLTGQTGTHPLLYGRRAAPSKEDGETLKGDGRPFRARMWPSRDVGRVPSVTISPVRPSPPPWCHPGHYSAIPDVV
jgi:hypothetical protein